MFSLQKMPNGQFSVLAENGAAVGSLTGSKGEWIAIARNEAFAEQPTKVRSVENAGGVAVVVRVDHKAR